MHWFDYAYWGCDILFTRITPSAKVGERKGDRMAIFGSMDLCAIVLVPVKLELVLNTAILQIGYVPGTVDTTARQT